MQAQKDTTYTPKVTTGISLKKPLLRLGCEGPTVVELQRLLLHWRTYQGTVNGVFDLLVELAVKAFQRRVFLLDDGVVESMTWQALYTGAPVNMPILQQGSQGESVITLQSVLRGIGYFHQTIDGKFDSYTDAAVRGFQRRYGLIPDGIVGPHTWYALSKVPH